MDLKYIFLAFIIVIIDRLWLRNKLKTSGIIERQQEFNLLLNEENKLDYRTYRNSILPIKFKVVYMCVNIAIGISTVLGLIAMINMGVSTTIKAIFLSCSISLLAYNKIRFLYKRNEYIYINGEKIYREIAKISLEVIDYIKYSRILICMIVGGLIGFSII